MIDIYADFLANNYGQSQFKAIKSSCELIELHGYITKNSIADGSSWAPMQTRVTFKGWDAPQFKVKTCSSGGIPIKLVASDGSIMTVLLDKKSLEKRFPKIEAIAFPEMMKTSQKPNVEEPHATIRTIAPNITQDQLQNALLATNHIRGSSPDQKISWREYNKSHPTRQIPRNIICIDGKPYLQLNRQAAGDRVIAKTTKNVRYCLGLHDNKLYAAISAHTGLGDDLEVEVPCLQKMCGCKNIVQAHGNIIELSKKYGEKKHYLIETLYTGGTLSNSIAVDKKLPIAKKLTTALVAMHQQGIIHRDLKPDNIFLDERGDPHIGDFGASCHLIDDEHRNERAGGTVPYMAPEFARAHLSIRKKTPQVDFQAMIDLPLDVYGMGCILYELFIQPITENPDFQRLSSLDMNSKVLNAQLQQLAAIKQDWMKEPNVSGTSEERRNHIIWSMLRADPAQRIKAAEANARFAAL